MWYESKVFRNPNSEKHNKTNAMPRRLENISWKINCNIADSTEESQSINFDKIAISLFNSLAISGNYVSNKQRDSYKLINNSIALFANTRQSTFPAISFCSMHFLMSLHFVENSFQNWFVYCNHSQCWYILLYLRPLFAIVNSRKSLAPFFISISNVKSRVKWCIVNEKIMDQNVDIRQRNFERKSYILNQFTLHNIQLY